MPTRPPSLPQLRAGLKQALAAERDPHKRAELGRAVAAIERAESKGIAQTKQSC
jgi:hypothetical protein